MTHVIGIIISIVSVLALATSAAVLRWKWVKRWLSPEINIAGIRVRSASPDGTIQQDALESAIKAVVGARRVQAEGQALTIPPRVAVEIWPQDSLPREAGPDGLRVRADVVIERASPVSSVWYVIRVEESVFEGAVFERVAHELVSHISPFVRTGRWNAEHSGQDEADRLTAIIRESARDIQLLSND